MSENPKTNPPWRAEGIKTRAFWWNDSYFWSRSQTVDEGLILVGDAAGFTSPLFEGGSHLALWSGREAAQVVAEAMKPGTSQNRGLRNTKRHGETFPPYDKILKGKTSLYGLTDAEMSEMANFLPEELGNMSALQKLGIGLRILVRRPSLIRKGVISTLKSFGYSRAKYFGW